MKFIAGVDTLVFKAGSLCGASATKAINSGVSTEDVMWTGRWSSWTVFDRFYNRLKSQVNILNSMSSQNQNQI
jgi:hypothetical protein